MRNHQKTMTETSARARSASVSKYNKALPRTSERSSERLATIGKHLPSSGDSVHEKRVETPGLPREAERRGAALYVHRSSFQNTPRLALHHRRVRTHSESEAATPAEIWKGLTKRYEISTLYTHFLACGNRAGGNFQGRGSHLASVRDQFSLVRLRIFAGSTSGLGRLYFGQDSVALGGRVRRAGWPPPFPERD